MSCFQKLPNPLGNLSEGCHYPLTNLQEGCSIDIECNGSEKSTMKIKKQKAINDFKNSQRFISGLCPSHPQHQ
jgi:hypothetical protein